MNCDFCGKELSKDEETNFVHYPHEKICDACMISKGLVDKSEAGLPSES